jgi:hypothetical protein
MRKRNLIKAALLRIFEHCCESNRNFSPSRFRFFEYYLGPNLPLSQIVQSQMSSVLVICPHQNENIARGLHPFIEY